MFWNTKSDRELFRLEPGKLDVQDLRSTMIAVSNKSFILKFVFINDFIFVCNKGMIGQSEDVIP